MLCTEWMSRGLGSRYETHLPVFVAEHVGCFSWGLVRGKTQTYMPWGWSVDKGEPPVWFHDLLHEDGTPYDAGETSFIHDALKNSARK